MGQISLQIPAVGQPDTTEDVKVQNDLTAIQNVINGNIDSTNITAGLAQSAAVNQSGQAVKGSSIISASQNTGSTTFTTLATPDQVSNIVLPSNGLLQIMFQATWQESVSQAAQAAIFIGSSQLQVALDAFSAVNTRDVQSCGVGASAVSTPTVLTAFPGGLASLVGSAAYKGDATTGQILGGVNGAGTAVNGGYYIGVTSFSIGGGDFHTFGGPCMVFAAAGTYNVSVQFKASSGTVTASNRRLYVQAVTFG